MHHNTCGLRRCKFCCRALSLLSQILATAEHFRECLRIRRSSTLFRLESAADIQSQVRFYNVGPEAQRGVIIMAIRYGSI